MNTVLSKSQKAIIILSATWIIIGLFAANEGSKRDFWPTLFFFSFPLWLYWSGVWIWGFGYLSKLCKKTLKFLPLRIKTQSFQSAWSEAPPHPWRRYFARMLDIATNGFVVTFCFEVALAALSPTIALDYVNFISTGTWGRLFYAIWTVIAASFLTAAIIGFTGSSLGKCFFGIRITDTQGKLIGYMRALQREMIIFADGIGCAIPIYCLFIAASAYRHLMKEGKTTWDKELEICVLYRNNSPKQIMLSVIGLAILVAFVAMLKTL